MKNTLITKQMINFNKTLFDNSYVGLTVLQDLSASMMDGYFRQFPWVTEDNKKTIRESFQYFRQMGDSCKDAVDKSFETFSEMIDKE